MNDLILVFSSSFIRSSSSFSKRRWTDQNNANNGGLTLVALAFLALVLICRAGPAWGEESPATSRDDGAQDEESTPDVLTAGSGTRRLTLEAEQLEIDLDENRVSARGVRLSGCGSCASPYSLSARTATLRGNGDVDLVAPVLRIGRVPILSLPWLRVRTGRRVGLLLPRLGWRSGGGFEVGQGVWAPLRSWGAMTVHGAYLTDLVGAEVSLEVSGDGAEVRATTQLGRDVYGARVEGRLDGRSGALTASARLDWTFDPEVERRFSWDLEEEARTYETTAAAVVHTTNEFQTAFGLRLVHDLQMLADSDEYHPLWSLGFDVLPIRSGHFWVSLHQSTQVRSGRSEDVGVWPSWRTVARPRLASAFSLGPLSGRWSCTSLHAAWAERPDGLAASGRNLLATALDLSFPLIKEVAGGRLHLVEPQVLYRLSLFDSISGEPGGVMSHEPWTWPVAGHALWVRLRSVLREPESGHELVVMLGQVVGFPRLAGAAVAPRFETGIRWRAALAELEMHAVLDEGSWSLAEVLVRAKLGDESRVGVSVGWRWLGASAVGLVGPDAESTLPLMLPWFPGGGQVIDGLFWTTLGGGFRIEGGAWYDVERTNLTRAGGGLSYRHRCGCLSASIHGWYRGGRRWPEVWLSVDIGGVGAANQSSLRP